MGKMNGRINGVRDTKRYFFVKKSKGKSVRPRIPRINNGKRNSQKCLPGSGRRVVMVMVSACQGKQEVRDPPAAGPRDCGGRRGSVRRASGILAGIFCGSPGQPEGRVCVCVEGEGGGGERGRAEEGE